MAPASRFDDVAEPFFPCSWDSKVWVSTTVAVGILVALASLLAGMGLLLLHTAQTASGLCFLGATATLCVVMVLSQYAITGYRILSDAVMVVRRRGSIYIPSETIEAITLLESDVLSRARRVYGTGWPFGNAGVLINSRGERVRVYVTRKDRLVLIERANDIPVLLSPDEPRAFIHAFHSSRAPDNES